MGNSPFFFAEQLTTTAVDKGMQRQLLGHDKQLMMLKMDFEKGAIGSLHQHPHTQATYILSGSFEFTIGDQKKILHPGDSCFMSSEIMHGCICLQAGSLIDVFSPEREDFLF